MEEQRPPDGPVLQHILNCSSNAIYAHDADGVFTLVNPAMSRITGYSPEELEGRRFSVLFDAADSEAIEDAYRRVQAGETVTDFETLVRRKDGLMRSVRLTAAPLRNDAGQIVGAVGAAEDITEAHRQSERLSLLDLAIKHADDAILITDARLEPPGPTIVFVNPAFTRKTGWRAEEVLGKTPRILQGPKTDRAVLDRLKRTLRDGEVFHGEAINYRKNGEEFLLEWHVAPVPGADGRATHYVSVQRDVTERQRMRRLVAYQAAHDMLTGTINRQVFEEHVQTLQEQGGQGWALLYVDLGHFSVVNETCGPQEGDRFLRAAAQRIVDKLQADETVARLGGDIFGCLMHAPTREALVEAGERILQALASGPYLCHGQRFPMGASIGAVAVDVPEASSAGALLRAAEHACVLAKARGRDRVEVYSAQDAGITRRRRDMAWVMRIEEALRRGQFVLLRQRIECRTDGKGPCHYEVLLRLCEADGSWVQPDDFIPAAERYHLMPRVDRWVVQQVARRIAADAHETADDQPCGRYFINISGTTLGDAHFCDTVCAAFAEHGIDPHRVGFEITETAAISNLNQAVSFIAQMRSLGCAIALDDFGTGLSSFSYLKALKVDYLKIDGSFVRRLASDAVDYVMVEAINRVGHVMGLRTVAECVSDTAVHDKLRQIGVDCFQGFAIRRPEPWHMPTATPDR